MAGSIEHILSADIMAESLEHARGMHPDEFRKRELDWLNENSPIGHMAVTGFFQLELSRCRDEPWKIAEPGFQGAVFGTYIARRHAEAGIITVQSIADNHRLKLSNKVFCYAHDVTTEVLVDVLGQPSADVALTIAHPVARTVCTVMLLASFDMELGDTTEGFISEKPELKPAVRRQAAGSGTVG